MGLSVKLLSLALCLAYILRLAAGISHEMVQIVVANTLGARIWPAIRRNYLMKNVPLYCESLRKEFVLLTSI